MHHEQVVFFFLRTTNLLKISYDEMTILLFDKPLTIQIISQYVWDLAFYSAVSTRENHFSLFSIAFICVFTLWYV